MRLPHGGHTRLGQRDSGHLAGAPSATVVGHRPGHKPYVKRWVEAVVKPGEEGAYVPPHLNFISCGKVHGRKAKASNRTMGKPAVRH